MTKAAQVHRIMSRVLGDWFKEHGYRSKRAWGSFWHRPSGLTNILMWVQLDKYGFDPNLGGKLWLNCCSSLAVSKATQKGEFVPPSTVCTRSQLNQWYAAKRAVMEKVLRQPDLGLAGDFFRRALEWDIKQPYQQGSVADMPYFDAEDVERWAELLLEILPAADAELERRIRKEMKSSGN
jgi:hypothetical protein